MSSFAALNGRPVLSGSVVLPFAGVWTAGLVVDAAVAPTGAATLTLDEGAVTLAGTLVRSREAFGRVEVLMVGGAGGLWRQVPGRHYRSTPASMVWSDILSACGETPSGGSSAQLGGQLAQWTRIRSSGADALTRLADALGGVWRVELDGTTRLLDPAATEAGKATTGAQIADCPAEASALWALDTHALLPGQLLAGRRVRDLEHQIAAQGIRTKVWYG